MKFYLLPFIVILFSSTLYAQVEREAQGAGDLPGIHVKTTRLYGKLVDPKNGKAIEAASVQLFIAKKDSLIGGMLSKPNGDFSFLHLPETDSLRIVVSAIGYEPWEKVVVLSSKDKKQEVKLEKDLGNISLKTAPKELETVTVVASRPAMEMGIDRKSFTVDKSPVATGGTAIDVMKNIPSVTVDIDGNVQLRNASPQIFVDGRPTILTLDQIPADNIEKVELITNPSAKFDAATSGGIINVVLKKNKRNGLNGIATVSVGSPGILNGNLNLNVRQGKFNFFTSGSYNESKGKARGETSRENRTNGVAKDYFYQSSTNERTRHFRSFRFGTDFFMDNRNTISLIQDFGAGRFSNDELQDQAYSDINKQLVYSGYRTSDGRFGFNRNSTRVNYKHTFPTPGKELTADFTYNYGKRSDDVNIYNEYFNPNGSTYKPTSEVRNSGNNNNNQFTFQSDFVNPINDKTKFEAGLRAYYNDYKSYYNSYSVNNGQETKLPLSNNYAYKEYINAIYATFSQKQGNFSYQVGLRAEYSRFDGELVDSAFKFGYEYPSQLKNIWDALFPSLFLTQKINETDQVQLNYSRRIRRPDFWQLSPFVDISDPLNLRQGNPALKPEYINSFELNYNKTYSSGNLLAVIYFKGNPGDITQYSDTITAQQYAQLQNAGVDPNAILNTFINGNTTNRYGAELTWQQKWGNFDITPTIDFQYRTVNATVEKLDLSNEGINWDTKLIINYKIVAEKSPVFNNLGFQLIAEYESPEVIAQGKTKSEYGVDFAMRKDFLKKNKGTLTFAINDAFNTRRWGNVYDTDQFYQDSYRRWNVRSFRLSFSYKFGNADFSLFNKRDKDNDD